MQSKIGVRGSLRSTVFRVVLVSLPLLAASGAGCSGDSKTADRGETGTPLQTELTANYARASVYEVELEAESEVGPGQALQLRVVGKLEAHPIPAARGQQGLVLRMRDARAFSGAGATQEIQELSREIARAFFVTMEKGQTRELRLARGMSAAAASVQRTLAAALQFSKPSGGNSWKGDEFDATGKYEVAYELSRAGAGASASAHVFSKKKLGYRALSANRTQLPAHVQVQSAQVSAQPDPSRSLNLHVDVRESDGEVALGPNLEIERVHYRERLEAKLFQGAPVASKTTLTLTRLTGASPTAAPKETESVSGLVTLRGDAPYPAAAPVDLDRARTSGLTFEQVVAELETAEQGWAPPDNGRPTEKESPADAAARDRAQRLSKHFVSLEAMFRRQPATVPLAIGKILAKSPAAAVITNALGSSGAPSAQPALLGLAKNRSVEDKVRAIAANSLIRLARPSEETVTALMTVVDDPVVGVHAVYALGSFARKLREDEPQLAERTARFLVSRLSAVKDSAQKIHVLRGIANSAYVGAIPAVREVLSSKDALLRSAAVESLRLMQGPEVDALIADRIQDERKSVRNAALSTARVRAPSNELIRAVEGVAIRADDGYGRMEAVRLMGSWLPRAPALREALLRIAQRDEEPRIRETAQKLIDG
ncbi:MAG TPA: HEAT repeat domain-containing protein [Polyangiaceae bacterium]|nr:HEAT repeat domain-containing protein [Polyangiaceae bacterium]